MSDDLRPELAGECGVSVPEAAHAMLAAATAEQLFDGREGLGRKLADGFSGLSGDLHVRAREWRRSVFRLLEQQRPLLEMAGSERHRLLSELARIVPEIQETSRQLASSIAAARDGDMSGDPVQRFSCSLSALENAAESLSANLVAIRCTWGQFDRAAIGA